MVITAISDLHGDFPNIEPCDLVLICGDLIPLHLQSSTEDTFWWYSEVFKPWASNLPCNKVLFIVGNHELRVPKHVEKLYEDFPDNEKVTFLCDDEYVYQQDGKSFRIYGTPWCKQFGHWAFMANNEQLTDIFSQIPDNLDILMTHDAPYGVSDIILQKDCRWADGSHIGSKPLAEAILRTQPKIVCHGHLHSTSHEFELLGQSKVINCSIKDENYEMNYPPTKITL